MVAAEDGIARAGPVPLLAAWACAPFILSRAMDCAIASRTMARASSRTDRVPKGSLPEDAGRRWVGPTASLAPRARSWNRGTEMPAKDSRPSKVRRGDSSCCKRAVFTSGRG